MLQGCGERGPMGPEGPRGPQGPQGPEILPTSFEFEVDLLPSNNFEYIQPIPSQIEVFSSDVMLAYVFEEYIAEDDLEVWRKLPLNEFNSSGTLLMDFDFTTIDVRIFLDANYTLSGADEFEGLLIRAVHIPADFLSTSKAQQAMQAGTFNDLQQVIGSEVNHLKLD
ncbi:collagen-like protein [Rhodohalobacter sp. SW132]|nr:collagen-like protein [Rhodohalobacter sp. SW132]